MGRLNQQHGFTIIEVVLVLAIMGLMISGIMVNANYRAEQQHYREAVELLRDRISGLFEDVNAFENNNTKPTAANAQLGCATSINRGSSECFYVGKVLTVNTSGAGPDMKTTLSELPLIGYPDLSNLEGPLKKIVAAEGFSNNKQTDIGWGMIAAKPLGPLTAYNDFSILVYRHPVTGQAFSAIYEGVLTPYTGPGSSPTDLQTNPNVSNPINADYRFCLRGGIKPQDPLHVVIRKQALQPSDVEMSSGGGCSA